VSIRAPVFDAYPAYNRVVILFKFIFRFPVIAVLLVTVSVPTVAVPVTAASLETTRALVVSVPLV
jgi:hypothetical protein